MFSAKSRPIGGETVPRCPLRTQRRPGRVRREERARGLLGAWKVQVGPNRLYCMFFYVEQVDLDCFIIYSVNSVGANAKYVSLFGRTGT